MVGSGLQCQGADVLSHPRHPRHPRKPNTNNWTQETLSKLNKTFKVQGIPSLIILDADGKLITKDGREAVSKDPTGEDMPWPLGMTVQAP